MLEPVHILGAMITPAVLISAAALLLLSTASRLGRVNDRLMQLMRDAERLQPSSEHSSANGEDSHRREYIRQQLAGLSERLLLLRSAITGMYVTIAIFIATSIAAGLYVAFPHLTAVLPNSIGMMGAVAFLYSIVLLILEGSLAHRLTLRDVAHVRSLLDGPTGGGK